MTRPSQFTSRLREDRRVLLDDFRHGLVTELESIERRLRQLVASFWTIACARGERIPDFDSEAGPDLLVSPEQAQRARRTKIAARLVTTLGVLVFAGIASLTVPGRTWIVVISAASLALALSYVGAVVIRLWARASASNPGGREAVRYLTQAAGVAVAVSALFLIALRFAATDLLFGLVSLDLAVLESALLLCGAGLTILADTDAVPARLATEFEALTSRRTLLLQRLAALESAVPQDSEVSHDAHPVRDLLVTVPSANGHTHTAVVDGRN